MWPPIVSLGPALRKNSKSFLIECAEIIFAPTTTLLAGTRHAIQSVLAALKVYFAEVSTA